MTVVNCSVSLVYEKPLANGQAVQTLLGYLCNNNGKDEFDLKAEAERYHAKNNREKVEGKKVAMWEITSLAEPKKRHDPHDDEHLYGGNIC